MCTLVPEKRAELTTEGGLDAAGQQESLTAAVRRLQQSGALVSLFIDAEERQLRAAKETGAEFVEIHTGHYADAVTEAEAERLYAGIVNAVSMAHGLGLRVNLGHGLDYFNIRRFAGLEGVEDYSIGHAIIARAVIVGLDRAVRDMANLVRHL